jgi:hypothetical protein
MLSEVETTLIERACDARPHGRRASPAKHTPVADG